MSDDELDRAFYHCQTGWRDALRAVAQCGAAAEREACIAALEAEADGFRGVRQWQAVAGIMACIDKLRARAEGQGNG